MVLFDLGLPARYRLSLSFVKKRKNLEEKPFFSNLGKVFRAKKQNKVSLFFRIIFEKEQVKKAFGANLAFLVIASSLVPTKVSSVSAEGENFIEAPIILKTQEGVQYPVEIVKVTQNYRFYHQGIDLDGETGDTIKPIMKGKVEVVEHSRFGYGNSVLIKHGGNTKSLYAHLSKIDVEVGQEVTNENKIGEMGASGRAFGDHLHLEVYENDRAINPFSVLPN